MMCLMMLSLSSRADCLALDELMPTKSSESDWRSSADTDLATVLRSRRVGDVETNGRSHKSSTVS